MRYKVEEFILDRFHPLWPSELVWKIYDIKNEYYLHSCYTSENAAKNMVKRRLLRV